MRVKRSEWVANANFRKTHRGHADWVDHCANRQMSHCSRVVHSQDAGGMSCYPSIQPLAWKLFDLIAEYRLVDRRQGNLGSRESRVMNRPDSRSVGAP
jgi:hypothetical protein